MKEKIAAFVSNPWVGLSGVIIGVVSLLLSVYFFWAAERAPLLEYAVYPVRSIVVAATPISDLEVSYKGVKVVGPVSILHVGIWNSGNAPVRGEDILTPVQIHLATKTPILSAKIRTSTRPESKVAVDTSNIQNGEVGVAWKILEENDGAVIEITYAGNVETAVSVIGNAVGQREISPGFVEPKTAPRHMVWLVIALFSIANLLQPYHIYKEYKQKQRRLGELYVAYAITFIGTVYFLYNIFFFRNLAPRFDLWNPA